MGENDRENISGRIKRLGFKPQREIVYCKLLPYANQLDEESVRMLSEIKANLGRAVMMREMRPGCGMWTARLSKYVKLYGMKFSKEDHLNFIHLMYQLVTIPNLEPWLVSKFSLALIILLKKKELISPEELELPWRPLYDLCKRIMSTGPVAVGMYRCFSSLDGTLNKLVHAARHYFPASATQEILDLFRPQLCPFDSGSICTALEMLEWFLPIALSPEKSCLGHQLWFHEFMNLWEVCHNAPAWEGAMMWLMARLAWWNIGYIDWEPHIPVMFTRFLRSLNLPVSYKNMQSSKHHKLDTSAIALWIVSVLGGGSSAQKYLDKFMKAIESYFHPANFGRWLVKLKDVLCKLPFYFVQRLHTERYKKLTWETPIPDSHRLTEEDITNFVESIKPVAMQAMFSKMGLVEVSQALQHLATLRPAIIIPQIIDRMYSSLEVLTEPHKLTAAMQCMVAVARPMVQGGSYKEGSTHVIPLLMSTLPGIDPNDIKKCFVTFQFISTFATLVPIVDCSSASKYWNSLTEEEETICLATADFEDFVLQFLDRCFALIESSSMEVTRLEREEDKRSKLENMAEGALSSTCTSVLMQTSSHIFKSALKKLHSFVTGHILETKVAGHFMATVVRSFAKVNPEETLRVLVPHLCDTVLALVESDDVLQEDILDNELLYNLLLLSEVVDCRGSALLPYVATLQQVMDRTLHLTCREGYLSSSCILRHVLSSLTSVTPVDYRSIAGSFDRPVKDYLPIKDWGKPGNPYSMQLKWYVPGNNEVACVQSLISRYLPPELQRVEKFISDELQLTREELHCSLGIVIAVLGCRSMLPVWDELPVKLIESSLAVTPFVPSLDVGAGNVTMPDGSNVRKKVADTVNQLQEKLLLTREDDTKSFFSLIVLWEYLLIDRFGSKSSYEMHWKNFRVVKKVLENKLVGQKQHLRALLIDRTMLQHESLLERGSMCLTPTHCQIMLSLLKLSSSHYSEVRSRAQVKLFTALDQFSYSYTVLIPHLLTNLRQDSNQFHEQFKGTLYVLLGPRQNPLVTRHNWEMLLNLWPAIVCSKPSEKLSVIRLMENIVETVHKHFPTITISLQIPDPCLDAARRLWKSDPAPCFPVVSEEEVAVGSQQLEDRNHYNLDQYQALLSSLIDAMEHENLHWRYHAMALSFLRDLVHPDLAYPARIVRYFLLTLIHDSLELRKIAIRSTVFLLKQQKRSHKKISVDPLSFSEGKRAEGPGERADNMWVQYCSETRPLTAEEWDTPRYIHKPYHGFYCWPKQLQVYAPSGDQPALDRKLNELTDAEKEVFLFFSDQNNVDRLIEFLALEEKKGKDKFNGFRFIMFKGLFRNHGDVHLKYFLPHLERLVTDKHESSQRCAAEVIAGMIRGAKHWPFHKVSALWESLTPIIRLALLNITVETVTDWGICFATAANRDPNRHHWLLELLVEEPLRDEASFIECGRLYALQGALNQQVWRVSELFHRLLNYLKPFLTHSFQNVRERLGSVISNIFEPDIVLHDGNCTSSPHIAAFVSELMPRLAVLYEIGPEAVQCSGNHIIVRKNSSREVAGAAADASQKIQANSEERDMAIRLLKTVCKWVTGSVARVQYATTAEYYEFFPLVCLMSNYEADEELSKTCITMLALMGQALTLPQHIPVVLRSVSKVSESASWWARSSCVEFLQVFVFHNMATVLSKQVWAHEVVDIVLRLLEDDWLEVREKASQVLGGLLHCNFIESPDDLIERFKLKSKTRLKKKHALDTITLQSLKLRHSGILGLCAFINAYPYDVPEFVPDMFLLLGDHLNDPQPIPSTIRKTLGDFKRTHHDSWEQHSLKFTEQQLAVLQDLTIPPTYYA
ncbi:proteasome activator complex subunit 4B-like isoform X2 [Zootermopsis nevadensis]|uniref:proteasome activator complex subunit 4B-like isoform X2 n=1 Tax=Zootermopsis nevadensis TaxID=136037 RepID=UPI000B8E660E|nr:proteasome activator complex subunit 4B-like isoform X2 [Zootermopsis nevadensis]